MRQEEHLQAQNRWRSLHVRGQAPVLQMFADYSPESWWWTRYKPSQDNEYRGGLQTACLSRRGFASQINIALMECSPDFVVFHRRTITSKVYAEVARSFVAVRPVFIVPSVTEATRNPTMPLPDWWAMVEHARDGLCRIAVEDRSAIPELRSLGVDPVLYLPPSPELPPSFRRESKTQSPRFRLLLAAESYPHYDLLQTILSIEGWKPPSGGGVDLTLALGEGPESVQEDYRDGLLTAAKTLLGPEHVVTWPWQPRHKFLRSMSRDVDGVIAVDRESNVVQEANLLGIPVYMVEGETLRSVSITGDLAVRKNARRAFWQGLK